MSEARDRRADKDRSVHTAKDNYTEDETEFICAMERWMILNRCRFPKFTDVLAVARSLGYKKIIKS